MTAMSFADLLAVLAVAVMAPLLAAVVPRVRLPGVVLELVAGIVLGPAVLGWIQPDELVRAVATIGLAFLLFLAGLEIDVAQLPRPLLRTAGLGFGLTLALGLLVGAGLVAVGWADDPVFVAVVLSATSLGLVVPVLKDAGQAEAPLGQLVIAAATVADLSGVVLLSVLFSEAEGGAASRVVTVGIFVAVVTAVALALGGAGRSARIDALLVRLQDTTAEIRVRLAATVLIGFAALAMAVGLETILGAFVAGVVLRATDRQASTHPAFRVKLDAVGYGFVIPVFFVFSGLTFDLASLTAAPAALARVPVLLAGILVARGVPALAYRGAIGARRTAAAALLQATSLPFLVTAAAVGSAIGAVDPVTAAALVAAGLGSVVLFPLSALALLGRGDGPAQAPAVDSSSRSSTAGHE